MAKGRSPQYAGAKPIVLVIVHLQYGYYRHVLEGIAKYVGRKWRLFLSNGSQLAPSTLVSPSGIAGFIAGVASPAQAELLLGIGVPGVNVSGRLASCGLPTVRPDDLAIGRMAAAHLLSQGHTRFACLGQGTAFCDRRIQGFVEALAAAGQEPPLVAGAIEEVLPVAGPLGLFVTSDANAAHTAGYLSQHSIRVPEGIAIVGVDNDTLMCNYVTPPLTSVDPAADIVGFEAARLLDEMITAGAGGEPVTGAATEILVPPRALVPRQSTDMLNVADDDLVEVIKHIRDNACGPMKVQGLASRVALGRRTLERRFLKTFGRSVFDEITRVRMEHARELLVNTDLKMPAISARCGYSNYRNFITRFRKMHGLSPGRFRATMRLS